MAYIMVWIDSNEDVGNICLQKMIQTVNLELSSFRKKLIEKQDIVEFTLRFLSWLLLFFYGFSSETSKCPAKNVNLT